MNSDRAITPEEITAAAAKLKFPPSRYTATKAVHIALERFTAHPAMNHCAPSVILTLQEAFDLPGGEIMPWVANSFQGGVCSGEICGTLSGAAIAYGLLAYQVLPHTDHDRRVAAVANAYALRDLTQGFARTFGAVRCEVLLGRDKRTPEENTRFIKENGWIRTCSPFVTYVIRALVKNEKLSAG
jgi:C_GCAxxG_C_C family probable redox protein